MTFLRVLLLIASLALTTGCVFTPPGVRFDRHSQTTRIVPVVTLDLVGTDQFRLHGTGQELMTANQLQTYFDALFGTHNPRFGGRNYSIILHSGDVPPPDTIGREAEHIGPVLAAAQKYGCGVCILYPEQSGIGAVSSYYEAFPSRRRQREHQ